MSRRTVIFLLLALIPVVGVEPSSDDDGWRVDGTRVPDEPWRGHDGPFLAQLILTNDAKAFRDLWRTNPGSVRVSPITRAAPGVSIETVVLFAHCQSDPAGNCNVWGTATVATSEGRVLADGAEVPLWVGHPPPPDQALGISEHGLGMPLENLDGSFTFRMDVTDRVAHRTVSLVQEITIDP